MKSIVVFCGSGIGNQPVYEAVARSVGHTLASRGIKLVYGGAAVGLMGAVADGALEAGGHVTGIIPGFLAVKEIAHPGVTDMIIVDNMHQRKMLMHESSEGIITLPGGWGTMEELFEMLTWAQLGLHAKPIGLLNVSGYYDGIVALCDQMVSQGFLRPQYRGMLITDTTVEGLLEKMLAYKAPVTEQLITESTT